MGGVGFDLHAQCGGLAAEALGADAQLIDLFQQLLLHLRVVGVGMMAAHRTQQGLLGQHGGLFKGAAHAHAHHDGRAGIGSRQLYGFQHEILHTLLPVRGLEHAQTAHVLAAEAFGGHGDLHLVAGHQAGMDDRRGIVAGVATADGVLHHGFAQKALGVALGHARMNGSFKIPVNVHLLADLTEYAGHAGILTDGQTGIPGGVQIVAQGL